MLFVYQLLQVNRLELSLHTLSVSNFEVARISNNGHIFAKSSNLPKLRWNVNTLCLILQNIGTLVLAARNLFVTSRPHS